MSKVIVITGAGVGLGRALARRFAGDGEKVVLLGRTAAKVEKLAAELGEPAFAVQCDVSSPQSVRAAFDAIKARHSKIDVLINNAAVYEPSMVAEATDEQITTTITTNLMGPIFCARSAIPMMEAGAHILNVSSESVEVPFPLLLLYRCSKAGLEMFSSGLSRELESSGVRVTNVRAGQMMDADKTWDIDPEAGRRFMEAAAAAGINPRQRPISQFASVTDMFRAVIDLPPDLHALHVSLHARKAPG